MEFKERYNGRNASGQVRQLTGTDILDLAEYLGVHPLEVIAFEQGNHYIPADQGYCLDVGMMFYYDMPDNRLFTS